MINGQYFEYPNLVYTGFRHQHKLTFYIFFVNQKTIIKCELKKLFLGYKTRSQENFQNASLTSLTRFLIDVKNNEKFFSVILKLLEICLSMCDLLVDTWHLRVKYPSEALEIALSFRKSVYVSCISAVYFHFNSWSYRFEIAEVWKYFTIAQYNEKGN